MKLMAGMSPLAESELWEKLAAERSSVEILWGLDPKRGGIAASVPNLAAAISKQESINAKVVALVPGGGCQSESGEGDHNVITLPAGRMRWLRDSNLRAELKAVAAEAAIIHIHGLWQEHGLAAAAVARKLHVPYIVSAHGMLDARALRAKRWKKEIYAALFERRNLARASALRAITASELNDYRRFGLKTPVVVIPNGVSVPECHDPQNVLERFPALTNQRIILFMGRLHPHKGVDLLIRAWSRIASRFSDTHLVVAGPDEVGIQAALAQLAGDLAISSRVTFTGMLKPQLKWSALSAAEFLVLPSRSEALSLVALEAMACARPVILTRGCNFPEVVSSQAGFIIDREKVQIERALSEMLMLSKESGLRWAREAENWSGPDTAWPPWLAL